MHISRLLRLKGKGGCRPASADQFFATTAVNNTRLIIVGTYLTPNIDTHTRKIFLTLGRICGVCGPWIDSFLAGKVRGEEVHVCVFAPLF